MKIYFLFYAYEKGVSANIGGFRKLWELADRLQKQGHKVRLFFPGLPKYYPLKAIPYSVYPVFNFFALRPLSAYLCMFFYALIQGYRERPEIIYFRSSPNIFPVILGRCLGAKVVLEVNVIFREFYNALRTLSLRRLLFLMIEKFNANNSDKIITLTPGLRKLLIKYYKIPAEKIAVIPSATDTRDFYPRDSQESKNRIGIKPDSFVIGFAGIFYPHQGVDTLIYAAKYILKLYPDAIFLIVGAGIMEKPWKDLVESEGLEDSFIFPGQITYENMPAYFNAMDISVAPFNSHRGETSPFKVFDALACAKAVIASDIPAISLLAKEFSGGILTVPAEDVAALAKVIMDLIPEDEKRNILGRNARRIILEKYSWEIVARQTAIVLKNLNQ